ncbi:MAG: hypothetical protein JSU86_08885 [Phycisphaerales bacterium]|nr:MAG: hypothetical protein JSU86_08885 [Phycisphaerales bacterium]
MKIATTTLMTLARIRPGGSARRSRDALPPSQQGCIILAKFAITIGVLLGIGLISALVGGQTTPSTVARGLYVPPYVLVGAPLSAAPEPQVTNVTAFQRDDASRLVNITYSLTGDEATYPISADRSIDEGHTWVTVASTAVFGDVGGNVVPGAEKQIFWNPALDWPDGVVTGGQVKIRVIASYNATPSSADSANFPLTEPGDGILLGKLLSADDGEGVVGALITIPEHSLTTTTDSGGAFPFPATPPLVVPAGEVTVQVESSLHWPVTKKVIIRENSSAYLDIVMTPKTALRESSGFGVGEVRGEYSGPGQHAYYLDGVPLREEFTAAVQCPTTGNGTVRWEDSLGGLVCDAQPCPAGTAGSFPCEVDMGSSFSGGDGTLTVVVEDSGGVRSDPYLANFRVVSPPAPLGIFPFCLYLYHDATSSALKYMTPSLSGSEEGMATTEGAKTIPKKMPLFGGEDLEFGVSFDAHAEINGDGTGYAPFFEAKAETESEIKHKKTKIAGASLNLTATGGATWEYVDGWIPGGWIQSGATLSFDVPPKPVVFSFGPVPCYFRGHIEAAVLVDLKVMAWSEQPGDSPRYLGTFTLDPFPYAEAMLGAGVADVCAVEGYLGGGARMEVVYPGSPALQTLEIYLAGGVRVVLWIFKKEWPLLEYTWDLADRLRDVVHPGEPILRMIPRDYVDSSYASFVANVDPGADTCDSVFTHEVPFQTNVFGQSTPGLAAVGGNLLAVWVHDDHDGRAMDINRTRIFYSRYSQEAAVWSWSIPAPVVDGSSDDGTPDFHPQIAALSGGDALLVWENVSDPLNDPANPDDPTQVQAALEDMKQKMGITVARYDGTWAIDTVVFDATSSDEYLDHSPQIACGSDNKAMLTWVKNTEKETMGTADTIRYATFNGGTWNVPTSNEVPTAGHPVLKSALAYDGANAVLVFSTDLGDNTETPEDWDLYGVSYNSDEGWDTAAAPLTTTNSVQDANPQVVYYNGTPVVVWYRAGDPSQGVPGALYKADLTSTESGLSLAPGPAEEIVTLSSTASSGAADFRLTVEESTGRMAVVWQDASVDGVDMWYAVYAQDQNGQEWSWSKPQRLTCDRSMEHSMAPSFAPGGDFTGNLMVMYDKVQIQPQVRTVKLGCCTSVKVPDVPNFAQTDLYLLRHNVVLDLAVNDEDVTLSPEDALAGQPVEIRAKVGNVGTLPAKGISSSNGVTVRFYHGTTELGHKEIARLLAGEEAETFWDWEVPSAPYDISVTAEPSSPQTDQNPNNDTGVLSLGKPDMVIDSLMVQAAGAHRVFTIRVANNGLGTIPAGEDVVLQCDELSDGPDFPTTLLVQDDIGPGAYRDLSWVWEDAEQSPEASVEVVAVADEDETREESDEDNNTRSVLVSAGAAGACCNPEDGTCHVEPQRVCKAQDNLFQGIGTACNLCDNNPFGAECNADIQCLLCYAGTREGEPCDGNPNACPGGSCVSGVCDDSSYNAGEACDCPGSTCVAGTCTVVPPACQRSACCDATTGACTQVLGGFCSDSGTCTGGGGEPCGIDADCPSGETCQGTTPCLNDFGCPGGETCEAPCPVAYVSQGFGTDCSPDCCAQPVTTGADTCDQAYVHIIHVPLPREDPVTITITGNNQAATFGDTYDDTCVGGINDGGPCDPHLDCAGLGPNAHCVWNAGDAYGFCEEVPDPPEDPITCYPHAQCSDGDGYQSDDPDDGTCSAGATCDDNLFTPGGAYRDRGWWEAFAVDACADVRIDLCCTREISGEIHQPQWDVLMSECDPCGGSISSSIVGSHSVGRDDVSSGRGAPFCRSDDPWWTFRSLEAGTYWLPVHSATGGHFGDYQMHITAGACPVAACCLEGGVCKTGTPNAGLECHWDGDCGNPPADDDGDCVGNCQVLNQTDCEGLDGYWLGFGVVPADEDPVVACEAGDFFACGEGACCTGPAVCVDDTDPQIDTMTPDVCASLIGTYVGGAMCDWPVNPCPVCVDCQAFEDDVHLSLSDWSVPTGAVTAADDFVAPSDVISHAFVWGVYLDSDPNSSQWDCGERVTADNADDFRIRVFADNGSLPGDLVAARTASVHLKTIVPDAQTTVFYQPPAQTYFYQLELDPPIGGLSPGTRYWLEVANDLSGTEDCLWFWHQLSPGSPNGNGYSAAGYKGLYTSLAEAERPYDHAFHLEPYGFDQPTAPVAACCHPTCDNACTDDMALQDCLFSQGQWNRGETCNDVTCPNGPSGTDDCSAKIEEIQIPEGESSVETDINTFCATTDGFNPILTDVGLAHLVQDIWYSFTPAETGVYSFSMCPTGTAYDSLMALYTHGTAVCPCAQARRTDEDTFIAASDEACVGAMICGAGYITADLIADTCYTIRVGGYRGARQAGRGKVEILRGDLVCPASSQPEPDTLDLDGDPVNQKVRYLSFKSTDTTRSPAAAQRAIRVHMVDLPAPYDSWNGTKMFVGPPEEFCENSGKAKPPGCPNAQPANTFWASTLECEPYFTDWSELGVIHVYHEGIIPNGVYDVQAARDDCDLAVDGSWSEPLVVTMSPWGDVVWKCTTCPCMPPDGTVGIPTDVTAILDKFKNLVPPTLPCHAITKVRADLDWETPNQKIDISDVTFCLDAFRGDQYPPPAFDPPSPPPCSAVLSEQ